MEKLIVTEEFYIDPRLQEEIEQQLLELPIVQYAWLPAKELIFSENVRKICREECPRYGTSWACPPAVGTVTECQERCNAYPGSFVFTTIANVRFTRLFNQHHSEPGHDPGSVHKFNACFSGKISYHDPVSFNAWQCRNRKGAAACNI